MSEMEAVNSFNAELQSLYDVKPPISKGKMTAITRAALKAVKLYKHAVQSVEKFIQKCKPEYKIPGLYVIDSIIRQSRHQFGPEKDVFATRFARNIQTTFVHLYKCPDEDKAKVIRVLNLWQKNRIFSPEVIQPLFDLADPNNPIWETVQQNMMEYPTGGSGNNSSSNGNALQSSNNVGNSTSLGSSKINDSGGFLPPVHFKKELLDYDYDEEEDMDGAGHPPPPPNNSYQQNSSMGPGGHEMNHNPLAGFDALGSILTNPEVLRQLQTLQEQMAAAAQQQQQQMAYLNPEQERQRKLAELNKQEAAFDQRLAQTVARLPFAVDCDLPFPESSGNDGKRSPRKDGNNSSGFMQSSGSVDQNSNQLSNNPNPGILLPPPFFQHISGGDHQQQGVPLHHEQNQHQQNQQNAMAVQQQNNPFGIPLTFPVQGVPPAFPQQDMPLSQNMGLFNPQMVLDGMNRPFSGFSQMPPQPFEQVNVNNIGEEKERDRRERDRRRRRSRSNERKNKSRSRSRTPSKSRRKSRSTSRNRSRKRHKSRSRSRDRKEEREKEKERQRKGLPQIKREHLSVCTTTLWVGHLSKLVSQEEISDTFGSYGDIVSIDVIPPRGCAFVVMNRRQDACRALDRLKNTKLQGKTITLAWAPGKGVKGRDWKDYWEVEAGVSYIPWGKLKLDTNIDEFEDGGCIDEDTLPEFLKNRPKPPDPVQEKAPPLPSPTEEVPDNPVPVETSTLAQPQPPALLPTPGIPSLLGPPPVPDPSGVLTSGDTDSRPEVAALVHNAASNALGPVPTMNPGSFPMPPPVGMMGVPPMGMNMMVPPPLMGIRLLTGTNMQGFQGLGSIPNLPNMPMMGMLGGNINVGNQGMVPPPMGAPGLLGDMPNSMPQVLAAAAAAANIQQQIQLNNSLNIHSNDDTERLSEEDRKRRADRRDNRIKKRSRFDDVEDRRSPAPPADVDNRNSPVLNNDRSSKDDRPLFERLKSLAEAGYGFGAGNNDQPINLNNLNNSLLGAPIGPVGSGPRAPGPMERMPNPHGFPQPLLPMGPGHGPGHCPGSGPGNQFGPRLPFIGERPQGLAGPGPRPWFDNSNVQNPFMNPNPFAGNPFIQTNLSENPFDMGGPGPGRPGDNGPGGNNGPGPGQFFGRDMGNFGNRGGGRGGHHHHSQGPEEGPEFWGRGGRGGGGRGRGGRGSGGGNWRGRWEEEEPQWDRDNDQNCGGNGPEGRDRDNNRGFRGGRGGGRGGARDNWQPRDRDRNDRESRDRDRERDHGRDRERGRERERSRDRSDRSRDRDRDRDRSGRDRGRDRDRRERRRSTEDTERKDRDHRNSNNSGIHNPPQVVELEDENWDEPGRSSNTPQEFNADGPPPEPMPEIDQSVSHSAEQEDGNPEAEYVAEENEESVQEPPQHEYSNSEYPENANAEEFEEYNEDSQYDNDRTEEYEGGEENYDDVNNGGEEYTEEPENFDRYNTEETPFSHAPQEETYMESEDVNCKSTNPDSSQNQFDDGYENQNDYVKDNVLTRRDSVHLDTTECESQKEPCTDLTDSVQLDKETNDNVNINSNE